MGYAGFAGLLHRLRLGMPFIGLSRPEERSTARELELGDATPDGRVRQALSGEAAVVAFLRHPGCPFAEETVRALSGYRTSMRRVVVAHGDGRVAEDWFKAIESAPSLCILVDTDREEYARWGVGLSDGGHFLGLRTLGQWLRLAARGVRNRSATGTRWQRAGTIAVSAEGRVVGLQRPLYAGDLPDLDVLFGALEVAK